MIPLCFSRGLAQTHPASSVRETISQSLTGPQLDDSLTELRATFSRIGAIGVPEFGISSPGYTLAIPSAFGSSLGTIYLTGGCVSPQQFQDGSQGGVGLGVGLGEASQLLGLELNYALSDLEQGFTSLSFKLHRYIVQTERVIAALAIGWEDAATTGTVTPDSSAYGVATAIIKISPDIRNALSRLSLNIGVGGGRFRNEMDIFEGDSSPGFFGGAALRLNRSSSVIAEWTGQDLAAGISWAPFKDQLDETVCGGLGDLVRQDVERFQALTEARTQATTAAEQSRLDREIFEQALRLPESITQDLGDRQLQLGQSEECDTLIEAVTQLMEQVADYVAALERSRSQISW